MALIDRESLLEKFQFRIEPHGVEGETIQKCVEISRGIIMDEPVVKDINVPSWIPVTEWLPESGVHVLLCCEIRSNGAVYKKYVCDGYYAKRYTEKIWSNINEIAYEYREEDDEFYLLEGWYEIIKNWDDYNSVVIGDFVTHWMPLPEPPKED